MFKNAEYGKAQKIYKLNGCSQLEMVFWTELKWRLLQTDVLFLPKSVQSSLYKSAM